MTFVSSYTCNKNRLLVLEDESLDHCIKTNILLILKQYCINISTLKIVLNNKVTLFSALY